MAANSLSTCQPSSACTTALAGTGSHDNGEFTMRHVDVDGDSSTFNSSTATLALPTGSTVLYAGLYWSADTSAGSGGSAAANASARSTVRFATPTAGYRSLTAGVLDADDTQTTRYQGFADVTSLVAAAGSGSYRVANVQAGTGVNRYAGWGLVVAYRLAGEPVRRLVIYDGFLAIRSGLRPNADITLDGFLTPATGSVGAHLAMLSYEGDRGSTGDSMTLASRSLSDAANPVADVFNSSIAREGATVTARSPSSANTLGVDADVLNVGGVLPNGVSNTTLRLATAVNDTFLPGAFALSITDSPPGNQTAPAVSGTPRDGQTLTATAGTWAGSGPIGYAYRWQRCNGAGTSCANVPGATAPTYALGAADVTSTMRVVVTATNAAGSSSAASAPSGQVAAIAPASTSAPTISGTTRDGELLTVANGTWTGTPTLSYAYQWQRCEPGGASCAPTPDWSSSLRVSPR
jgi:hypothetical protein